MPDPVHAIGPDGKHYQFPAGYTPDQVKAYFSKGAQKPALEQAPGMGHYLSESLPTASGVGSNLARLFGLPGSTEEWKSSQEEYAKSPVSSVLKASSPMPVIKGIASMPEGMAKEAWRGFKGTVAGDPMAGLHNAAALNPFAAPIISQMTEQGLGTRQANEMGVAGAIPLALSLKTPLAADAEALAQRQLRSQLRQMTKQQIVEQAHAKLNSQVEPTQQLIRNGPLTNMRKEVAQHVQGLDAGDVAQSPQGHPQVNTTSLHPLLDDITNSHRSAVHSPRFNQAMEEVQNLPPNAYWKDVQAAKMRVRSMWAKASEGTPEKSALDKLSTGLEDILAQRADEIGQTKQYNKYRELTRAYHTYESSDNVIGKVLDTSLGRDMFNTLRDPAYADQLSAASKDFAKYGMPEGTLQKLVKDNSQLHDFVNTANKSGGFRGKIKAIMSEPVAAMGGMFGGSALGSLVGHPTLGGLIGAMKGSEWAETAGARNVLAKQGLAPSRELIGAPVQPADVPRGTQAPTKPSVSVDDLMSALKGQGIGKTEASGLARQAVQDNPNDFTAALKQVLQRKQPASATPKTTINASGESSASAEALGRVAQERDKGITRVRIDTRSGKETPLWGVDAVDAKAGPYDKIVRRSPQGETVLDKGAKAK